jgi:hypothetical protein
VLPPLGEAGDLPAPDGTRLAGGGAEVLAASPEAFGLMPDALLVRLRGGLRKKKKES